MSEPFSDRSSPGSSREFLLDPGVAAGGTEGDSPGTMPIRRILRAIRRRPLVALVVFVLGTSATLFAIWQPVFYRATAVVRLAGERRALSAGMQPAVPLLDRSSGPLLSLVPILRSRTLIGLVVDSLGLQLQPLPPFSLWNIILPTSPELELQDVRVDPNAPGDTLYLAFGEPHVLVWRETKFSPAPYGKPLQAGPARFIVPAKPKVEAAAIVVWPRDRAIDRVRAQLAVDLIEGTDALEVKFTDPSPARAQSVVNEVVKTLHDVNIRSAREQARRQREFFASQLKTTDSMLAQTQASLSSLRSRQRLGSSSDKMASQQAALATLDARRGELYANRRVYRSLLRQLTSSDTTEKAEALRSMAYSPEIAGDAIVERLYQQLLAYQTRLDSLTAGPWRSSDSNPDVLQLRELLRSAQGELVRAVRANVTSLEARSEALESLRVASVDLIRSLPALQAEEMRREVQVTSLSSLADQLRLEHQKSRISEELEAGDVEIVDLAALPYQPAGLPWWVTVGVAMGLGLLLSAGAAMLLETRDRSIREPEELARALPVRGLGVIPPVVEAEVIGTVSAGLRSRLQPSGRRDTLAGVVADSQQPSIGAEAFRMLYSSLTFGWGEGGRRIFLVTSVGPQEGKTLVAANLAATFAREGARVLLVDCDLRRPRLHQVFQVSREPGFTNLLTPPAPKPEASDDVVDRPVEHGYSFLPGVERPGQGIAPPVRTRGTNATGSPLPDANRKGLHIRTTKIHGLSFLPCGPLPPNPAEMLKAGRVRQVLDELDEEFDLIILDTPPVLVSADALILAPLADGVLLVVRAGQTDREAAELAYQQLTAAGAIVLGAILNDPTGVVSRHRKLYYGYDYADAG